MTSTNTTAAEAREHLRGMALSLATGTGPLVEPRSFDAALDAYRDAVLAEAAVPAVVEPPADRADVLREADLPARIDRMRPEFTEHASIEAIDAQLDRARRQERRWHLRVEWLIGLRQARTEQPAVGERQDGARVSRPPA